MYLKVMSEGNDRLEFTYQEFRELFGISRTTLYRHLSLLAKCAVLQFKSPGSNGIGKVQVFLTKITFSQGKSSGSINTIQTKNEAYLPSTKERKRWTPEESGGGNHDPFIHMTPINRHSNAQSTFYNPNSSSPKNKNYPTSCSLDPNSARIFRQYEENIGTLTPMIADEICAALDEYPTAWIQDAIRVAVTYNKRSWAYCRPILERWRREGKDSGDFNKGKPRIKNPTLNINDFTNQNKKDPSEVALQLRELYLGQDK